MFGKTQRNHYREAILSFIDTFQFAKGGDVDEVDRLSEDELKELLHELGWRTLASGCIDAVRNSIPESWFKVRLNGVNIELPRYTLMTMSHCVVGDQSGRIDLYVETDHWNRLMAELAEGAAFIDIGAATGVMSVCYALALDGAVDIFAFEPSRRARGYLEATIAQNRARNVMVFEQALSDFTGHAEFIELPEDVTENLPYLPEASRLAVRDHEKIHSEQAAYPVEVATLDGISSQLSLEKNAKVVIKIDVEGFEESVLEGGLSTIEKFRPFIAIDIHAHPTSGQKTDEGCQGLLRPLGYEFERIGHVLVAVP